MKMFPLSPCTVVYGDETLVALEAGVVTDVTPNLWHVAFSDEEARGYEVGESLMDTAEEVRFNTPNGIPVTIRHVVESDSEAGGNHPFFPNHPLPVEVIGAIMAGTQGPTDLYAVVDGDEHVNTLALVTNTGMYLRYGRAWHAASSRQVMGRNLIPVDDLEVEAYDQADEAGTMLTRNAVAPSTARRAKPIIAESRTDPVTASAPTVAPVIASLDDLPTAVEFASEHPESRWYVAKRARALGVTDPMPWED